MKKRRDFLNLPIDCILFLYGKTIDCLIILGTWSFVNSEYHIEGELTNSSLPLYPRFNTHQSQGMAYLMLVLQWPGERSIITNTVLIIQRRLHFAIYTNVAFVTKCFTRCISYCFFSFRVCLCFRSSSLPWTDRSELDASRCLGAGSPIDQVSRGFRSQSIERH